jgi:CheY-like chemotaxis protein
MTYYLVVTGNGNKEQGIKIMKNISTANTESIVFIVENDTTRRMLKMYLAAVGLNARTYTNSEEYAAWHDSSSTQSLVLDMQLPGMDGAILQRQIIVDKDLVQKNSETFQLIPIKNKQSFESLLLTRFASRDAILGGAEDAFQDMGGWEQ